MKMIIVALALVAVVASSALPVDEPIQIVRSDYKQDPNGAYEFGYESANGIQRQETGELKQALDEENKPHDVIVVRGSYSYADNDGKVETVNYFADETGYHAEGDSIPKAPVARR